MEEDQKVSLLIRPSVGRPFCAFTFPFHGAVQRPSEWLLLNHPAFPDPQQSVL